MNERTIPAGTRMFFGAPANPMPKERADILSRAVAQIPGVGEAYIPQTFIEGDSAAHQVLFVGFQTKEMIAATMPRLMFERKHALPPDVFIDVFPRTTDSLRSAARVEKCRIFGASKKPWWKIGCSIN